MLIFIIISSNNVPESHWPIGRILEVYPVRDGIVCSNKLKIVNYLDPVRFCGYLKQQINQIPSLIWRGEYVMLKHNIFMLW